MARNMNSGYVGRYQSRRAEKAIRGGEYPLSMITTRILQKAGIDHGKQFIVWLCREGYIRPTSHHHRGNPPVLTRFYKMSSIKGQLECLAVDMLLDEWMGTWKPKGYVEKSQGDTDGEEQSE